MQNSSMGLHIPGWDAAHSCYACTDGAHIACSHKMVELLIAWVSRGSPTQVPANALVVHLPYFGHELRFATVSGALLDRDLAEVLRAPPGLRECTLPRTCARIAKEAFADES